MKVICAWCLAVLHPGPSLPVSHGICPTCEAGVDVALVPVSPNRYSPVVDVALVPAVSVTGRLLTTDFQQPLPGLPANRKREVSHRDESADGSACSSTCGFCGRCTDGVNANCLCADCGEAFWKGPEDADSFCDGCRASRDAWADALEIRMAKARVDAADVKKGAA